MSGGNRTHVCPARDGIDLTVLMFQTEPSASLLLRGPEHVIDEDGELTSQLHHAEMKGECYYNDTEGLPSERMNGVIGDYGFSPSELGVPVWGEM